MEPEHEHRQFMYLQWEDKFKKEKPYQIVSENIPELDGLARSNINMIEGPEELIEDIRGRESTFTLDQNGFQILTHQFPPINYQSNDEVEHMYKPEIERLLKEEVSAIFAVITPLLRCFTASKTYLSRDIMLCSPLEGLALLYRPCFRY
jgi:hypothetical protein